MKKIKGILLFGILTLLGIGGSFGYNGMMHYIDFQNYSSNKSWSINAGNTTSPISYFITATDSTYYSIFLRKTSSSNLFDISTYELSSHFSANYLGQRPFYFDTNGNRFATVNYSSNSSYGTYLIPITSSFGSLSVSDNLLNNTSQGIYARVFSSQNSCFSNYALTYSGSLCTPDFVQIFAHNKYTITSIGNNYDSQVDGVNYYKGGVSPSINKGYSFAFVDGNGRYSSGNNYYLSGNFHLKSILYSGSNVTSLNNILLFRLNNNSPVPSTGTDNYQVIALALTSLSGSSYPIVYSIYSCPYNSNTIYQCSFVEGGTTNSSFVTQFYDSTSAWNNLTYFLTKDYGGKMYNSYSSVNSTLTFYRYVGSSSSQWVDSVVSKTITLDPSLGYNIIENIPSDGGNGEQFTGLNVIPFSSLYYQCLGPSYNTPDGLPPSFCLNPDGTLINVDDYRDCYFTLSSSGDLMENMFCNNDGYVQEMAWVGEGSGGYYSACYGEDCGVMFVFGPSYLNFENSFNLTTGLILDMITNITGWVAKCPYPYTDFQLGKNSNFLKYLKTLGFKYDPFIFINCVVAGFHYGRHTIDNTMFGDTFEHPLLYGDTPKHRTLFVFLDFIVVLGLFGLFAFIRKIF